MEGDNVVKKTVFFVDELESLIEDYSIVRTGPCTWKEPSVYVEKKKFNEFKKELLKIIDNIKFHKIEELEE